MSGEIFKLKVLGNETYIVSSAALVEELCDETRFEKKVDEGLAEMRHAVGDGLFTAHNHEPNWGAAHRTLTVCIAIAYVRNPIFDTS